MKTPNFENNGCFYHSENAARNDMKKVPILPTRTLKEHPSITYWYVI
jgi:hypothetical protein